MKLSVRLGDLLFGSQPTPETLEELAKMGFKTILNTRGENELKWDEKAKVESLGMRYVSIPMPYPIAEIKDEWVEQLDNLLATGERPLVLHCSSGNRIAGLWAVWLNERQGRKQEEALEIADRLGMTRIRPLVEKRFAERSGTSVGKNP
jgi:uncharacterized protein (TIGR01244 family)